MSVPATGDEPGGAGSEPGLDLNGDGVDDVRFAGSQPGDYDLNDDDLTVHGFALVDDEHVAASVAPTGPVLPPLLVAPELADPVVVPVVDGEPVAPEEEFRAGPPLVPLPGGYVRASRRDDVRSVDLRDQGFAFASDAVQVPKARHVRPPRPARTRRVSAVVVGGSFAVACVALLLGGSMRVGSGPARPDLVDTPVSAQLAASLLSASGPALELVGCGDAAEVAPAVVVSSGSGDRVEVAWLPGCGPGTPVRATMSGASDLPVDATALAAGDAAVAPAPTATWPGSAGAVSGAVGVPARAVRSVDPTSGVIGFTPTAAADGLSVGAPRVGDVVFLLVEAGRGFATARGLVLAVDDQSVSLAGSTVFGAQGAVVLDRQGRLLGLVTDAPVAVDGVDGVRVWRADWLCRTFDC